MGKIHELLMQQYTTGLLLKIYIHSHADSYGHGHIEKKSSGMIALYNYSVLSDGERSTIILLEQSHVHSGSSWEEND